LDDIARAAGGHDALLDVESKAAASRGLKYMDFDAREELLRDALLLKTPIVRPGKGKASVGIDEIAWKEFAAAKG
jgi:arsenate reductase-like glutaredoxin family protein